ncbi:unnamed protein product [Aphanomyces euteiches]
MAATTLSDLLSNIRAGKVDMKRRLPLAKTPPVSYDYTAELTEDDWDFDDPTDVPQDTAIYTIAPKRLASQEITHQDSTVLENVKTCTDMAIVWKQKALDLEKAGMFKDAMACYSEAGWSFLRTGRATPAGTMQNALKMEAFSMLKQAERLSQAIETHSNTCSTENTDVRSTSQSLLAPLTVRWTHAQRGRADTSPWL